MNVEDFELLLPKAAPDPLVVPRWGVVTQASPLLVQLAGDAEPLAVNPKTLTGGLVAGDVVWCVLQGRDLLVVSQLGQPSVLIGLASPWEVRYWRTPGTVHLRAAYNASTPANTTRTVSLVGVMPAALLPAYDWPLAGYGVAFPSDVIGRLTAAGSLEMRNANTSFSKNPIVAAGQWPVGA